MNKRRFCSQHIACSMELKRRMELVDGYWMGADVTYPVTGRGLLLRRESARARKVKVVVQKHLSAEQYPWATCRGFILLGIWLSHH